MVLQNRERGELRKNKHKKRKKKSKNEKYLSHLMKIRRNPPVKVSFVLMVQARKLIFQYMY